MKAIRHQIALLIAVFALGLSAYAEESASTIMQRCADKFKATPALTARFAIANTAKPVSGTFTMSRSRFRLSTPPMSIWYDGKTQWTYIDDNKEVNISEPTREELMESNPFEVITSFNSHYRCRKLKSAAGTNVIELTPKSPGQAIAIAKITISKATGWPTAISVTFDGGNSTSVAIADIKPVESLPAQTFTFDKKEYPNAEIVDLR